MTQQQIIYIILIPFVVWRLYSRMSKLLTRQEARPGRLWVSVILFPILTLCMAWATQGSATALGSLAGGACCGIALAMLGLRLTQFDVQAGKLFYQPNRYIGMGLMMVFATRIAYRFLVMPPATGMQQGAAGNAAMQGFTSSPLTMIVMGLVFCYYAPYSAGILLRRARLGKETNAGFNLQQ